MEIHREKKRVIIGGLCFLLVTLLVVIAVSFLEYRAYLQQYNEKLNALCLEIETRYPEVTGNDIMDILNSEQISEKNFFSKYGIRLDTDSVILQNEKIFYKYLVVNIFFIVLAAIILSGILFAKSRKQEKEIAQIARYLKKVNQGDYRFDMHSSSEGELSALESELYKTTIMLKEAAENSRLEKERLKDSLSDISHQLKTPITSLVINLENLLDHPDIHVENRNRLIANAVRDTNRLSQMVQQLLTLSKLDANVIRFKKEQTGLGEIVKEAMNHVAALSELLGIPVTEECLEDSDAVITCDSYWEKQAVTNILKNGIEHAKSKVIVRYSNCELYKEIIIENDGEPISETDKKNIFKRFYCGENTTKDSVGIGLSLAHAVVKQDGGYIVVESDEHQVDSGVRFIIRYL